MKARFCVPLLVAACALSAIAQEYPSKEDYAKLVAALPAAKTSLVQGIEQVAKGDAAAISAKFELGDDGKLSLSIYLAEKGLGVDAEGNVLSEVAGDPTADAWKTEREEFTDAEHLKRSSSQLVVMSLAKGTLADIVRKAEAEKMGTVFAITPVVRDRHAMFVVFVAGGDKMGELHYDAATGEKIADQK